MSNVFAGGVIVSDDFKDELGLQDLSLLAITVSIYDVACAVGSIIASWLGERLGRKWTIFCGTVLLMIGALLQTLAFDWPLMLAGRVVAGLGNGINTSTAPVLQSETSKAHNRGKLVITEMSFNVAGFSLSNFITLGFFFTRGTVGWRAPLALQLVFIIVLLVGIPFTPESPR